MKNDKKIEFKAKFKKINLFNETLHIIIFPEDGLRTANNLYNIEEGQEITVLVKT